MSLFHRSPKREKIAADDFTRVISAPSQGNPAIYSPGREVTQREPLHEGERGLIARPAAPDRNVACMVTHGMGQQVPFQTVAQIAEAVGARASFQPNRVQLSKDADLISRLETSYRGDDEVQTNVHLYEGYWAPLTEGKISFWETIKFLYSGGVAGVATCLRRIRGEKFDRWMFGEVQELPIKPGTLVYLLALVIVVSITVLLYTEFLHILSKAPSLFKSHPSWPLTLARYHLSGMKGTWHALWAWAGDWVLLAWHNVLSLLLLLLAVLYTYGLSYFIVEYAGDVAIYVSSYKVSKYEETRTVIQKSVFTVGQQIYEKTRDLAGTPFYDEVVLVGHSLGSVITYDLLNQLIVWDQKEHAGRHRVVDRTTRLITFGSPLDKTAFLFRTQISPDHHYREALAGLQQPLIMTYAVRPSTFKWINLYSPADIISGELAYYDCQSDVAGNHACADPNVVENHRDPSAWMPLYAHMQYWNGQMLAGALRAALFAHSRELSGTG
jgi:hypothetical protein